MNLGHNFILNFSMTDNAPDGLRSFGFLERIMRCHIDILNISGAFCLVTTKPPPAQVKWVEIALLYRRKGIHMIPGEILPADGDIELNAGQPRITLTVANTGDRPIQVGSHYHFAETNPALSFDRVAARGHRLDIAAGTAVRFEPGQTRDVILLPYRGDRVVQGFRGAVMGALD